MANFKGKGAKCEHTARETAKRKVAAQDIRRVETQSRSSRPSSRG